MIRVAAWVLALITAVCLYFAPIGLGSLALAILFALFFVVAIWPTQQARAVSPQFERDLTLSTLDRLDGLDTRKADR